MFGIGTTELLVVMVVMVILFGHRLPSLMRSLGQSATAFKHGLREVAEVDDPVKTA
jgi:sec-independent protein translocase protein TatA